MRTLNVCNFHLENFWFLWSKNRQQSKRSFKKCLSLVKHYWYNIKSRRKQRSCFSTSTICQKSSKSVSLCFFGKTKKLWLLREDVWRYIMSSIGIFEFLRNLMIIVKCSCNLQSCNIFDDGFVILHQLSNLLTKKTQARREAKEYLLQSLEKDTPTCCYVWKLYSSYWHSAAFFFFTFSLWKNIFSYLSPPEDPLHCNCL